MDSGCFGKPDFHEPPLLALLMRRALKFSYSHYAGALPSKASSHVGPWHRDTYDLFEDDAIDVKLPPYYYTVLIPLVELTLENGATEFLIGSHQVPSKELAEDGTGEVFQAACR